MLEHTFATIKPWRNMWINKKYTVTNKIFLKTDLKTQKQFVANKRMKCLTKY